VLHYGAWQLRTRCLGIRVYEGACRFACTCGRHAAVLGAQVVAETYEELVFSEPSKQFYERAKGLEPEKAPRPELSVLGAVSPPTPQEELDRLNAARRQIAISTAKAQKQMAALIAA